MFAIVTMNSLSKAKYYWIYTYIVCWSHIPTKLCSWFV